MLKKNKLFLITLVLLLILILINFGNFSNFGNRYFGGALNKTYIIPTVASVPLSVNYTTPATVPENFGDAFKAEPILYLFDVNGVSDITDNASVNSLFNKFNGKYYNSFNTLTRNIFNNLKNKGSPPYNGLPDTNNSLPTVGGAGVIYPFNIINLSAGNLYDYVSVTPVGSSFNPDGTLGRNQNVKIDIKNEFPYLNQFLKSNNNYILGISLRGNVADPSAGSQIPAEYYIPFYYILIKFNESSLQANVDTVYDYAIGLSNNPAFGPTKTPTFISVWKPSPFNKTIIFPFLSHSQLAVNYNNGVLITDKALAKFNYFTVYWGHGASETYVDSAFATHYPNAISINFKNNPLTHIFPTFGNYTISISGYLYGFSTLYAGDNNTKIALIQINNWGCLKLADYYDPANSLNIASSPFYACSSFTGFDAGILDKPDLSLVTSMKSFFNLCIKFNSYVGNWDTSKVTDMSSLFYNTLKFNNGTVGNVGSNPISWNTPAVTDMNAMFLKAEVFNQEIVFSDTSKVTNMSNMFYYAKLFNNDGKPISWDTPAVTDMRYMFNNAAVFNQNISNWNIAKVTNFTSMFISASALLAGSYKTTIKTKWTNQGANKISSFARCGL